MEGTTIPSETVLQPPPEAAASDAGRFIKFGFFAAIALAMFGWLSLLGWILAKLIGL